MSDICHISIEQGIRPTVDPWFRRCLKADAIAIRYYEAAVIQTAIWCQTEPNPGNETSNSRKIAAKKGLTVRKTQNNIRDTSE